MSYLSALFGALPKFAKQVLIALGFTYVSYSVVASLFAQLLQKVVSQYQQLPPVVYQLAEYSGVWEGIGILFSAFTAGQALVLTKTLKIWGQ